MPSKLSISPKGYRLGIGKICKDLGVTRDHLRKVLKGHRESHRLMSAIREKYPELLSEEFIY